MTTGAYPGAETTPPEIMLVGLAAELDEELLVGSD
jgi:hypothetical protein